MQVCVMQMQAVAASMQLNDDDAAHTIQTPSEEQLSGEASHTQAAADSFLPTIDEAALGTGHSSPESSARMGSGEFSTRTSSRAISEFAFDSLDVPDVVETTAAGAQAAFARQTSESGQEVITVILSEEQRQLKDSAKEVHEQQSKGKVGIEEALDQRPERPSQVQSDCTLCSQLDSHTACWVRLKHSQCLTESSFKPKLPCTACTAACVVSCMYACVKTDQVRCSLLKGTPHSAAKAPFSQGSGSDSAPVPALPVAGSTVHHRPPLPCGNAATFGPRNMLLCAALVAILAVLFMVGKTWFGRNDTV